MFAKRHYEAIAQVMRKAEPSIVNDANRDHVQWMEMVRDLAELFERDNPRFDIIRFVKACRNAA